MILRWYSWGRMRPWLAAIALVCVDGSASGSMLARISISTDAALTGSWEMGSSAISFEPNSHDALLAITRSLSLGVPRLRWPTEATAISSSFGVRVDPWLHRHRFHYGVDLDAAYGAHVVAADAGTVSKAGWNGGHGLHVVMVHHNNLETSYSHLSEIRVRVGDVVAAGEVLGCVGSTGRATGPHLHMEVLRKGLHLDPMTLLAKRPLALREHSSIF